jgi:hypothetical protein
MAPGIALAVMLALLSACGDGPQEQGAAGRGLDVVEIPARWSTATASSVEALAASSDAVFVGRVVRPLPQRSETLPGRGNGGAGAEIPVSAFDVTVEAAMKGAAAAGASVVVEQPGGTRQGNDGDFVVLLEGDELIQPGRSYLFFAVQKENGALTAAPFGRFEVAADGTVSGLPEWQTPAARTLVGQPVSAAASLIGGTGE